MSEFMVAFSLVFVIEGLMLAAFPGHSKRALAAVTETPDGVLRTVGLVSAVAGVILVWLIRG